jgi:O-antigen/teichoic acid export membrane protein
LQRIFDYIRKIPALSTISNQNFENMFWLCFDRVFRMVAALAISLLIARHLGPAEFGKLGYAQSLVGIVGIISTFGLENILTKRILSHESSLETILGSAFYIRLIGALITNLITAIFAYLYFQNNHSMSLIIFLYSTTVIFQSIDVIKNYFEAEVTSKYVVWASNISFFLTLCLRIYFLYVKLDVTAFALSFAIDAIFCAILNYYFYYKKTHQHFFLTFKKDEAKVLIRESFPLAVSGLSLILYMRLDALIIEHFLGIEMVGHYTAATRLTEVWYIIPTIFVSTFLPKLLRIKNNPLEFAQKFRLMFKWIMISSFVLSCFLSIGASPLIKILYGTKYLHSIPILVVHSWTVFLIFIATLNNMWLIIYGLQKEILKRSVIGTVMNISLNILLTQKLGLIGVAISTVLSYFITAFVMDLFNKKTKDLFYHKLLCLKNTLN